MDMNVLNMILIVLAFACIALIVARDRAVGGRFPLSRMLSVLTVICIACATWLQLYSPLRSNPPQLSNGFKPWYGLFGEILFDLYVFVVLFALDLRHRKTEVAAESRQRPGKESMSLESTPFAGTARTKIVTSVVVVGMTFVLFPVARTIVRSGLFAWLTPEEMMGLGIFLGFCLMETYWLSIYCEQRLITWR